MYEAYIPLVDLIEDDAQLLWNSRLPNEAYRPDIGTIINNANIIKSRLISLENETQQYILEAGFELRGCLNSIQGYSTMIAEYPVIYSDQPLGGVELAIAIRIREHAKLLFRKIYDLLDARRIEADRFNLYLEKHDLVNVLASFIERRSALQIDNRLSESLICSVDVDQFYKIIDCLLKSVIPPYSPANITFFGEPNNANSCKILIEVVSSAIQVTDVEARKLLDADYANTRRELGFFLVNEIMRLHNGEFQFAFIPGKRANFTLILPTFT
jgi:signal transduction histidine kinase